MIKETAPSPHLCHPTQLPGERASPCRVAAATRMRRQGRGRHLDLHAGARWEPGGSGGQGGRAGDSNKRHLELQERGR